MINPPKRLLKICLSLCVINFVISTVWAASVAKSDLIIKDLQIGTMDQDNPPENYSIFINLKNTGDTLNTWQLGFYMPRTFYSLAAQQINPYLALQVCDPGGKCANLHYVKASSSQNLDLSQGYFTLLEPLSSFPLKTKQNYVIRLAHSNQWAASNVSSLPQSFFIISDNKNSGGIPKIYTIATELSQYNLLGYDHSQKESEIAAHLALNWQQSQEAKDNLINVVPNPVNINAGFDNGYKLPKQLTIHNQLNGDNSVAGYWAPLLQSDWHLKKLPLIDNDANANNGIIISSMSAPKLINNSPEGYRLIISENNITIEALTGAGVYYALQTLRQITAQSGDNLPSVMIVDYPRFKYRGILLDVARHYFSIAEIENLLDVMAAQKLNTLHLHLSDDEAFRLALTSNPNLALIGANRGLGLAIGPNMLLQNNLDTANLSQPTYPVANSSYSGSYTPEDIKQLLNYANVNQISVIPELDMPGHARALIKALPESLVDPNDSSQFISVQGYTDDVLPVCTYGSDISVGEQFTTTINKLLAETAALFKLQSTVYALSNEISLGGDEVSSNAWSNDTSCRDDSQNLSALEKAHGFFQKVAQANPDLLISGWQQLLQNDDQSLGKNIVSSNQTGHVWVWSPSGPGKKQAASLANKNYPVVLAYSDKSYFDLSYTPSMYEPGFSWATSYSDTAAALSMAREASLTQAQTKNPQAILGLEGTLWSENLPSQDHLMYMALPKMPGLAEAAWSPINETTKNKQLDWQGLATRLGCGDKGFLNYLHKFYGVNYRGYPNGISLEVPQDSGLCPLKVAPAGN